MPTIRADLISGGVAKQVHRYNSAASEASAILRTSPGSIRMLHGYNSGGAQFIQLHDATSVPADTAVPFDSFAVEAIKNWSYAVPEEGIPFANGLVICNSSTAGTKTIGSADNLIYALTK